LPGAFLSPTQPPQLVKTARPNFLMLYRTFYKDFEKEEWESAKQVGGVRVEMKPKI